MADVRWICLSDTHFGAENSILSHVPAGSMTVEPQAPSPVLTRLIDCLRAVVETNKGATPPTLILNGDILELALAEDNVAATSFAAFIRLAFASDKPLFDTRIYYVPGNHDHHLWEAARERQYVRYIKGLDPGDAIKPPWHVTRLFEDPSTVTPESELLNTVLTQQAGTKVSLRVVYPNLGIESDDGARVIVIHHGHFTEPIYRLISTLKGALFPRQPPGLNVWDWEADNFAWIDFFWSTLGRSGEAGTDVGLIYDMLQDEGALGALAANLARFIADQMGEGMRRPVARLVLTPLARLARLALPPLARRAIPKLAGRERSITNDVLSPKTTKGMHDYLAGPVRRQLEHERPGSTSRDLAFVFGHTHKPFERSEPIDGFLQRVFVVNSGGWVVDTKETATVQGASIVLIDSDCGVASLRMYNQADDPQAYAVRLADAGSPKTSRCAIVLKQRSGSIRRHGRHSRERSQQPQPIGISSFHASSSRGSN